MNRFSYQQILDSMYSLAIFVGSACLMMTIGCVLEIAWLYGASAPPWLILTTIAITLVAYLGPGVTYVCTARPVQRRSGKALNALMVVAGFQIVPLVCLFIMNLFRPSARSLIMGAVGLLLVISLLAKGMKCYAALDALDAESEHAAGNAQDSESGEVVGGSWPEIR